MHLCVWTSCVLDKNTAYALPSQMLVMLADKGTDANAALKKCQ